MNHKAQLPWRGGQGQRCQGQRCELEQHMILTASVRGFWGQLQRLLAFVADNESTSKAVALTLGP